jgi:hypothetical protein
LFLSQTAALSGSIPFSQRYYANCNAIKNIKSGATTSNLINLSTNWATTAYITSPIHNTTIRGSTGTNLATLSATMSGASTIAGPSIAYNGFPAVSPSPSQTGSIHMSTYVQDKYFASAVQSNGFYLDSLTAITLQSTIFNPSSTQYNLAVSQTGTNAGSATFGYYFDHILTSAPNITNFSSYFL